jgi:CDP-diacylglycerol--serine O-phosphatidyltransferase
MSRRRRFKKPDLHRRVYVIPNLITSLNLFAGFYAIIAATNGFFYKGAVAIILAGVFDNLDGKVARATKSTSAFGVQYDSLCDLVSFGVAPGLLMYMWALQPFGRLGWLAAFVFVACGALRLARFNVHAGQGDPAYFTGLPIPGGAGLCAVTILLFYRLGWADATTPPPYPIIMLILVYGLSFLMISSIPYASFKKSEVAQKKSFNLLAAMIILLALIAVEPEIGLFLMGMVYFLHGLISALIKKIKRPAQIKQDKSADEPLAQGQTGQGQKENTP